MVTSYETVRTNHIGCKVEDTPLLVRFCPSDPCLVAPLSIHFLFPSPFAYDVLLHASLAQTLLISDCHLKKGTIIKRDFGLGIGYPSIVKYLEAI